MADAKPFWSALYHSLTLTDIEDYDIEDDRFTRISARCIGSRMMGKSLKVNDFGGQGGSSTPDASLFRAAYYQLIRLVIQQLNYAEWPQFCDHSVTSADVRLSVGVENVQD